MNEGMKEKMQGEKSNFYFWGAFALSGKNCCRG